MKVQMLNSFTNFLEKTTEKVTNLRPALQFLRFSNYFSHSVEKEGNSSKSSRKDFINKMMKNASATQRQMFATEYPLRVVRIDQAGFGPAWPDNKLWP